MTPIKTFADFLKTNNLPNTDTSDLLYDEYLEEQGRARDLSDGLEEFIERQEVNNAT